MSLSPLAAKGALGPLAVGVGGGGFDPAALAVGLVSWWKMDEASGTRYDSIGSLHFDTGSAGQVSGVIGSAADMLAASSNWLAHAATWLSGEQSFTVAQWQYRATLPMVWIFNAAPNSPNAALYVYYQGSFGGGRLLCTAYDSVSGSSAASFIGGGSSDAWRLLVFGYDASVKKAFASVDAGDLAYGAALSNGIKYASAAHCQMGRSSGAGYQNTRTDEAAFWSRALPIEEIVGLYNGGAGRTYPLT